MLFELDEPIHSKHFKDGYPLCWNQDETGTFEGTWDEGAVSCKECIEIMKE